MTLRPLETADVHALSIAQVEAYLQKAGWKKTISVNPRAIPYEGPLDVYGNPIMVIVPASKDLIDADRRLDEVVNILSKIEDLSPARLVQAMQRDGETRPRRVRARTVAVKPARHKSTASVQ